MSLTEHLKLPTSPVRAYLAAAFPVLEQSKKGGELSRPLSVTLGLDKLPPCILPSIAPNTHQGTIGIAADYRIRYHLKSYNAYDTVAAKAVTKLSKRAGALCRKFLDMHNELIAHISPAGRQLNARQESTLITYCIILAKFEQVARVGLYPDLEVLLSNNKVDDLFAVVNRLAISDVWQLSGAFAMDCKELMAFEPILNPTFQGSRDVGGADADFIINNTLIELKCTSKLDGTKLRTAILQLLGYVLLDYENKFAISELFVYCPRQRFIWRRPLWHFLLPPSELILRLENRKVQAVEAVEKSHDIAEFVGQRLVELRTEFRKVVEET